MKHSKESIQWDENIFKSKDYNKVNAIKKNKITLNDQIENNKWQKLPMGKWYFLYGHRHEYLD